MRAQRRSTAATDGTAASPTLAPGKRARTTALPARRAATPVQGRTAAAPIGRPDLDAAFDFVQRRAAGSASDDDVLAAADRGVADAASPLPHAAAIQRAFGRHDVRGVRAQVGGAAAEASAAIGAVAYATGDRVAFAAEPDLHLAAHEAAHVVQQRGGVQLAGGVGAAGDRYEVHADRVADLVVAGRSAEAALDELAGGAAVAPAVQRHDSPTHVRIGDSVPGQSLTVTDGTGSLKLTPGECAALVDYIGDLRNLEQFTLAQVRTMQDMLRANNEDAAAWDQITGGMYTREAQDNEKHFAPGAGDGGLNFRDQFLQFYARAIDGAAAAPDDPAAMGRAQADEYTAEHYLQDAFSAGHQLAAKDVENAVAQQMGWLGSRTAGLAIGRKVWAGASTTIQRYGYWTPLGWQPLQQYQFVELAIGGSLLKGVGGVTDAVRRYVHEHLDSGVQVSSQAHPEPWLLRGDHALGEDKVGQHALQVALDEARTRLTKARPGDDGRQVATELFDRHCPVPTSGGRATIDDAIADATGSRDALIDAVAASMIDTIKEVMDYVVGQVPNLRCIDEVPVEPHPTPDIPDYVPDAPVTGQPVGEPGAALPPTTAP